MTTSSRGIAVSLEARTSTQPPMTEVIYGPRSGIEKGVLPGGIRKRRERTYISVNERKKRVPLASSLNARGPEGDDIRY